MQPRVTRRRRRSCSRPDPDDGGRAAARPSPSTATGRAVVAYLEGPVTQFAARCAATPAGEFAPRDAVARGSVIDAELGDGMRGRRPAAVAWSRRANTVDPGFYVEAADRGPSGDFGGTLDTRILACRFSDSLTSTASLGVAPNGGDRRVWQDEPVRPVLASSATASVTPAARGRRIGVTAASPSIMPIASQPVVGMTGNGTAIAAWSRGARAGPRQPCYARTRAPGGAGFGPTVTCRHPPRLRPGHGGERAGDALHVEHRDGGRLLSALSSRGGRSWGRRPLRPGVAATPPSRCSE